MSATVVVQRPPWPYWDAPPVPVNTDVPTTTRPMPPQPPLTVRASVPELWLPSPPSPPAAERVALVLAPRLPPRPGPPVRLTLPPGAPELNTVATPDGAVAPLVETPPAPMMMLMV